MAETTYTYSVANDFPATGLDSSGMVRDIRQSAIVTALERIDTSGDVCDIVFKDALSAGDKTLLDGDTTNPSGGLIAAHTGDPVADSAIPITTERTAADGTPEFATRALVLGRDSFKRTDDGTELMNIDGRAAGAADVMWNGTGAGDTGGDWAASSVGASTGVESTESKRSGTNGWDTTVTSQNDQTVLDNGSSVDVVGTYSALEFWMQPKAYPPGSNLRLRWVDGSNNLVGNQVNVSSYVSNFDLDSWQQVSIPIADFNLTGDVQKLQIRYRAAAGQHFWFDDFDLINLSGGGPYRFRFAAPDSNTIYHMSMAVVMVAAPSSGWNINNFANIVGGLSRGVILRQRKISTSEVIWKFIVKDNLELFGQFHPQEDIVFADDNLLMGFMVKPGKSSVLVTDDDVLEVVVRDDLSTITDMRAYCHYGVEEIDS